MYRVFFVFLMMAVFAAVIEAQLTFSTDWGNGKRSIRSEAEQEDGCATEESVFAIYKLIQREAEKFLACQTGGKN